MLGGGGGMPRSLSGVPYSPDCALSPFLPSGASSLDPVAPAPPQAATPALQQHQTLLAQLQQIWGEEGGRGGAPAPHKAPPTPGFGGGVLGGGASEQQTQQLAALLFMQQLELTQQASLAGQHGGVDDGALLSPRQLPAASADMLRDVLGSPLSLLPHGGGGGWGAGEAEGGAEAPMRPSMSLTNELAAAQVQVRWVRCGQRDEAVWQAALLWWWWRQRIQCVVCGVPGHPALWRALQQPHQPPLACRAVPCCAGAAHAGRAA